jgi:hypothetical protein
MRSRMRPQCLAARVGKVQGVPAAIAGHGLPHHQAFFDAALGVDAGGHSFNLDHPRELGLSSSRADDRAC